MTLEQYRERARVARTTRELTRDGDDGSWWALLYLLAHLRAAVRR